MTDEELIKIVRAAFPNAELNISGEACKRSLTVLDICFEGKSLLERHKMVNQVLKSAFESGSLQPLTIIPNTPKK